MCSIYVFCLICLTSPYFNHDAFMHQTSHLQDAPDHPWVLLLFPPLGVMPFFLGLFLQPPSSKPFSILEVLHRECYTEMTTAVSGAIAINKCNTMKPIGRQRLMYTCIIMQIYVFNPIDNLHAQSACIYMYLSVYS